MEENMSPKPQKVIKGETMLTFPDAMKEVVDGKKVTRVDWNDKNVYGLLKDGFLMIHIHEEFKQWIVNDGDLMGTDWVVVEVN